MDSISRVAVSMGRLRGALLLVGLGLSSSVALARTPTPTDGPSPTPLRTESPQPTETPEFPVLRVIALPDPARSGQRVTLDGSASFGATGAHWEQDPNDAVRLQIEDVNALVTSFIAPPVAGRTSVYVKLRLSELIYYGVEITILPSDTIEVRVGYAGGAPGGSASVDVSVRPLGLAVTEVRHELGFEPAAVVAERGDGAPDCAVGPDIDAEASGFSFLPDGCVPAQTCDRVRATLVGREALADQAVLYSCRAVLTTKETDGCLFPLTSAGGDATTQDGARLAVSGLDGYVVSTALPDDLIVTFEADPPEPQVGDSVRVSFDVFGRGGLVVINLGGTAPFLSGPTFADTRTFGRVTFDLRADCPGTANLQIGASYETDIGCPGNHVYAFVYGGSPVFPLTIRDVPGHRVSGRVAAAPFSCAETQPGVTVTLEPLGWEVPSSSGDFAFDGVPPGNYTLTVEPACTRFACWAPHPITVGDSDVSVVLCPDPVAPPCAGDCNNDQHTEIDELIRGVAISLGQTPLGTCERVDSDHDGEVHIDELIRAVLASFAGCPIP